MKKTKQKNYLNMADIASLPPGCSTERWALIPQMLPDQLVHPHVWVLSSK